MERKVLSVGMVGVLIALLTAVLAPASAQAAATPSTSPKVIPHLTTEVNPTCQDGYACAVIYVDDSAPRMRYVFRFYYYQTYELSNWNMSGWAVNRQTGTAKMRLLDQYGGLIDCVPPGHYASPHWGPVWKIQLTPNAC